MDKSQAWLLPPPLVVILRSATSQLSTQCHFWKKYLSKFLNVWIRTRKRQCPHLRKIYAIYQIWMQLIFSSVFHPYEKYILFIKFGCSLYSLLYFNLFSVHWDKHSNFFSFWSNNYGTLKAFISYNVIHITSKLEWDTTIKTFIAIKANFFLCNVHNILSKIPSCTKSYFDIVDTIKVKTIA